MKQLLTKEDVADAIQELTLQNKKPTLAAIHALLGHGSMSTLVKLKGELDAAHQAPPATDSPESLQMFQEIWASAVAEGRKQQDATVSELKDNIQTLAVQLEQIEGDAALSRCRAVEIEKLYAGVQAERQAAQAAASGASAQAAHALQQLADAQAAHASAVAAMQAKVDAAVDRAHELELELARAQARLEVEKPAKK